MTARKPVSALALGLSCAVAFGFGAGQASADVNQVVQHRLTSIQGDPTPSPVLALSALFSKTDAAALLKQMRFASQTKLADILRKLPDASKLEQRKLAGLAKSDQAKAQAIIANEILAQHPHLSKYEADMAAALLVALLDKSPNLVKADLSSLPELSSLNESQARAAMDAFLAKVPSAAKAAEASNAADATDASMESGAFTESQVSIESRASVRSHTSNLTKEDVARILLAIQKADLTKIAGASNLDTAKTQQLADAIVAKQPDLSKDDVAQVLNTLGKLDASKIAGASDLDLSKVSTLSTLNQAQLDAIAAAIAAQPPQAPQQQQNPQQQNPQQQSPQKQNPQAPNQPQAPQNPQQPQAPEAPEAPEAQQQAQAPQAPQARQQPQNPQAPHQAQAPQAPQKPQARQAPQSSQQQPAVSHADLVAAQDALTKIDPASLPDLSEVDLSKLGAPSN